MAVKIHRKVKFYTKMLPRRRESHKVDAVSQADVHCILLFELRLTQNISI